LTRLDIRPLTFGAGPHFCIGSLLGKTEAALLFTAMLRRYRKIELATEDLTWRSHITFRGLAELPLDLA
jgi:cytochrome P450